MLKKILLSNFQNKMSKVAIVGALLSVLNSSNIWASNQDDLITTILPKPILAKIFAYLSINDLGKVAPVCKKFDAVSKNDIIWKDIIPDVSIKTKEDCKKFLTLPFKVEEKPAVYANIQYRGIEIFYHGTEVYDSIFGHDITNNGATMCLECKPAYCQLVIFDQNPHEITYYKSAYSSARTENNIIFKYNTKK